MSDIRLRPTPFWTPSVLIFILTAAGGPLGFLFGRIDSGVQPSPRELLGLVAFMLVAAVVVVIIRWRTRPRSAPVIALEADSVRLPLTAYSSRTREVPYADVLSVDEFGAGKRARMLVNTRGKLFVYPLGSFDHEDPATTLRSGLRAALAARGADTLVREMDERESLGKRAWLRKPIVTIALLASIGIVFLGELALGALDGMFWLVKYGANAPALVRDGQWFRLFSANFLHLNALHLWMNAIALFSLGLLLEKLTGRWRFTGIYLLSALGGALASALLAQAALSVGASTAIYGLLGSLAVLNWKYRAQLPSGFRQTTTWWIFIVALNVVLAALLPAIDVGAHAGGALAGAATTLILYWGVDVIRVEERPSRALGAVVSTVVAAFGAALVITVFHSRSGNATQDSLTVARDFVNSTATKPDVLNSYAWDVYLDEEAPAADLELALQAIRNAIARQPDAEFFDTQGALQFRTGQIDEAVRSELRALALQDKEYYWWQLTRFLARRVSENGPVLPDTMTSLRLSRVDKSFVLDLRGTRGCPSGCTLYALAREGESVTGVLQLTVGAGTAPSDRLEPGIIAGVRALPRHASLELALVEIGACGECRPREIGGRYVPLDEKLRVEQGQP